MKTILYSVIAICFFASCQKEKLPDVNEPEQLEWNFSGTYINNASWGMGDTTGVNIFVYNNAYPSDSPWNVQFSGPNSNGVDDFNINIGNELGSFSFNFLIALDNGTTDSIYGSGFLSEDAINFTYHYQNIDDDSAYGDVDVSAH